MTGTGKIVIRDVAPEARADRRAKMIAGRPLRVGARAFRDGHGILAARARWRSPGGRWTEVRLEPGPDDWFGGTIEIGRIGHHELVIDAWTARYRTWCRDLRKWLEADEDVSSELLVGAAILDELVEVAPKEVRQRLVDTAALLRDDTCADRVRYDAALDDAVVEICDSLCDPWDLTSSAPVLLRVERELAATGAWYEMFPRSEGGFAGGAIERLDAIAAMGFDIVYLPPIHPIGATHRKGRHNTLEAGPDDPGSPWAIGGEAGGHTAIEPSLGTFEDFDRFVARANELSMEVALDYALQCSPDHPWIKEHPEWFAHRPDGTLRYAENPPKKYQDIHPIEFWPPPPHRAHLWEACRDILEFWIARGVTVFRVDNPHTKPIAFWEWLIEDLGSRHPEVVLLSEAFTRPAVMHELAEVGFSQSYTYFTWRLTAGELGEYVEELARGPKASIFRPNFWPSTPDILFGPLRDGSEAQFRIRALLAALLAPSWGLYSGYELCENVPASPHNEEYSDSEKYRIVERDWDQPGSLAPFVAHLNEIRRAHQGFWSLDTHRAWRSEHPDVLAWSRTAPDGSDPVLVIANCAPDDVAETVVHVDGPALGVDHHFEVVDELTGEHWWWRSGPNYVRLDPDRVAHVFSITGGRV